MSKNKSIYWIIGILIIGIILWQTGLLKEFGLYSLYEEGFITIGESNVAITGPINSNPNWACFDGTDYSSWSTATCDTKFWNIYVDSPASSCATSKLIQPGSSDNNLQLINGVTCIGGGYSSDSYAKLKFDIKGKHFRIDINQLNYGQSFYQIVSTNGNSFDIGTINLPAPSAGNPTTDHDSAGVEIKSHVLDNGMDIYFKGKYITTLDVTSWDDIYFVAKYTNTKIQLINPRYKMIYSCQMGPNDILVVDAFGPSTTIDLYKTRYPVKSFCLDHPAIITDAVSGGSTATAEIYEKLTRGESFTTSPSQTLTLFYIVDNSNNYIGTSCDYATEFYNIEENQCVPRNGIAFVCPEGIGAVFNKDLGVCSVTADVACTQGGTWNSNTQKCEYPYTGECISPYTLSADGTKCELMPIENIITCIPPYGLVIDNGVASCVYHPPVNQLCESGTITEEGTCELVIEGECPLGYEKTEVIAGQFVCRMSLEDSCKTLGGDWVNGKCDVVAFVTNITTTCTLSSDCLFGYNCLNGKCIYIEIGCSSDYDCPSNYQCMNKKCVQTEAGWKNIITPPIQPPSNGITTTTTAEKHWYEEHWMWLVLGILVLLFIAIDRKYILKDKRSFLSIWVYKFRIGIFLGMMAGIFLAVYYWNLGEWILGLIPYSNNILSYIISGLGFGIIGGFVYDILKKYKILR